MSFYNQNRRGKFYLVIFGLMVVIISIVYTNYITGKLAEEERSKVALVLKSMEQVNKTADNVDLTLPTEILKLNQSIPIILVSEAGTIDHFANFGKASKDEVAEELDAIIETGQIPIESMMGQKIYYKQSIILTLLNYYPIFQFFLIAAFILFGYSVLNSARRAEQNRVWVGMAKETAHQLGTPISGIVGWMEHLKEYQPEDEYLQEIVSDMGSDVDRLELIAERFSKIGSNPELKETNLYVEIDKIRDYMLKRSPRRVTFQFPEGELAPLIVRLNPPLFAWVLENLIRNALDALEGKGEVSLQVENKSNEVQIHLSDTGKGMNGQQVKNAFKPGFTTKKRGWGLGLSLAKRIIENYHQGKIFIKTSQPNIGTTFTIVLPKK